MKYIYKGQFLGTDLIVHWSYILSFLWLFLFYHTLPILIIMFIYLFFLILIHEIGHYVMAKIFHYRVYLLTVYFNGGSCHHDECHYAYEDSLIASGGVFAQMVLLILNLIIILIFRVTGFWTNLPFLYHVLFLFLYKNIFIMIFNLLPFPGLDGQKCWKILKHLDIPYFLATLKRPIKKRKKKRPAIPSAEAKAMADQFVKDVSQKINEIKNKESGDDH